MIDIKNEIDAPPSEVWKKLTKADHMSRWWQDGVTMELENSGEFFCKVPKKDQEEPVIIRGHVTAIEIGKRLQIDFKEPSWTMPTRLEFIIDPVHGGKSKFIMQHSGWEILHDESQRNEVVDRYLEYWNKIVHSFTEYCKT